MAGPGAVEGSFCFWKKVDSGTAPMVQWFWPCLPVQGVWVWFLTNKKIKRKQYCNKFSKDLKKEKKVDSVDLQGLVLHWDMIPWSLLSYLNSWSCWTGYFAGKERGWEKSVRVRTSGHFDVLSLNARTTFRWAPLHKRKARGEGQAWLKYIHREQLWGTCSLQTPLLSLGQR